MSRRFLLRPSLPAVFLSHRHRSCRREITACLTLNAFLLSGWLLPFLSSLQVAQAREVAPASEVAPSSSAARVLGAQSKGHTARSAQGIPSSKGSGRKAVSDAPPSWYRAAQAREGKLAKVRAALQGEMKQAARHRGKVLLAQAGEEAPGWMQQLSRMPGVGVAQVGQGAQVSGLRLLHENFPVPLKQSAKLYVPNPYTSPLKVDLSNGRVPSQQEVSGLGSSCGALAPAAPAEPAKFQEEADTGLKGQGYEQGLDTKMPPSEELVMDPPRFKKAKHLEEVRERVKSAKNQNRDLAGAMMDWNTARWDGAKKKLEKFAHDYPKSPWGPEALIHLADLAKSSAQPNEAEDGYRKVLEMTSDKSSEMSFEAHQKAYERWADLYLREGRYGQARPMLEDIVKNDLHWRRVTWAYSWLMQLNAYSADQKTMLARLDCGSKALATLLVDMGHAHAGREVAALSPTDKRGFSLADLQQIGAKRGVQLVGFRARAAQLVGAPLPLILHYAARGVAPTTARRIQSVKLRGAPSRAPGDYAHFVVVRGYDARSHQWSVFNPQDGTRAFLTSVQLDKESSGTGLMMDKAMSVQAPAKAVWLANWPGNRKVAAPIVKAQTVSLSRLSRVQMQGIVGTCYAVRAPGKLGCHKDEFKITIRDQCGNSHLYCAKKIGKTHRGGPQHSLSAGEPSVSVDPITQNIYVTDTPVWYQPAKGPEVDVSLSYNSQDASNYDSPTGNKWTFGFTSHVAEMPNQVSVFMPDGAQDVYTIPSSAITTQTVTTTDPNTGQQVSSTVTKVADTYVAGSPRGVFSTLTKTAAGTFSLRFPNGEQWNYGIPSGTGGTVPLLLSQTDEWSQSLTLQYGTIGGKIVPFTLTDADGKLTRFQYDGNGRLIYAQTPDERQASFSYDASGNLIQCVDAAGQAFQYAYDSSATVTQLNTAQGAWTFNVQSTAYGTTYPNPGSGGSGVGQTTYRNFSTTITDPTQSHPQRVVYSTDDGYHNPGHYYFTDHTGTQTQLTVATLNGNYDLNPISEIASMTAPVGAATSSTYDTTSGSRLTAPVSVSNGRTITNLLYNAQGEVTQAQTGPSSYPGAGYIDTRNNRTITLTYDPSNSLDVVGAQVTGTATNASTGATQTQSQAVLQNASYNPQHQPLAVVDAQGHETDTSYTPWGAPSSVTVYEGTVTHVTQYAYGQMAGSNEFNRVVAVVRDGVTQATYTYDASGRVRTSTDITGQTTLVRYNNLDSPLGVYYPDGTSQTTDYTCCALPGMVTDRSGRRSYYDYDQLKRLVRVQDADGQTLQFDYNADGDRISMLDANGVKTKWAYDANHRPVAKQYADGSGESWDYTNTGQLNSATNGRGQTTSFGYSGYGELTNVNYPNTATTAPVTLSYDPLGRKTSMTDGMGTSGWSYDGTGRLTGESGPFGNDGITYSYDSLEHIQSLSIARDATTSDSENFGFDGLGRLASVTASAGGFGNVGTFSYGYVGNTRRLSRMDRPNGTSTLLSYENLQDPNSLHRLTGVQDISTASGANIAGFGYGYDSPSTQNGFLDNRTSQTRAYGSEGAQTVSYGYNPTSMLQGEGASQGGASTPALSKSYSFDPMGNRLSMSDSVAKTQTTSTYNNLNQLVSMSNYSTSSGQAVATGSSALSYDGDGNMSAVLSKDVAGTTTGQTSYSYDDASRLIGITTPNSSKWQFVYDGMDRLRVSRSWIWQNGAWVQNSEVHRVYLGMDVVQERDVNNNVVASYTRTGNIGGLLARSTSTGSVFYGYDGTGNVTSLTDSTGATVGTYTYDAWGNLLNSSGSKAQENPYRFSTKEQLAGLYCYGYRFYSSGLGRWINRDPIREQGGVNLYEFVNDSPTNQADLYGQISWACFWALANVVGVVALNAAALAGVLSVSWVPVVGEVLLTLVLVGSVLTIGASIYSALVACAPPAPPVTAPPGCSCACGSGGGGSGGRPTPQPTRQPRPQLTQPPTPQPTQPKPHPHPGFPPPTPDPDRAGPNEPNEWPGGENSIK